MSEVTRERSAPPSPDEAFAVLGNGTRMAVLQALAAADDGPLTFSELRAAVGMRDSGQFNYHVGKLEGHFVERTDDGYLLRRPGRRVVEAVLSGAITEDPTLEPAAVDLGCRLCGAPIRVGYESERVDLFCTACAGQYGVESTSARSPPDGTTGYLGALSLPPAGVRDRSPDELLRAGSLWGHLAMLAWSEGVCPHCSAVVEHATEVCAVHETGEELCANCDRRHAVQVRVRCTNCGATTAGLFGNHLFGSHELRAFVADHGLDPVADGIEWGWDYDEELLSADPLRARFTYEMDGDTITLTVDEDLRVVETVRSDR